MTTYTAFNSDNIPVLTTTSFPEASARLAFLQRTCGGSLEINGREVSMCVVEDLRWICAGTEGLREPTESELERALEQ